MKLKINDAYYISDIEPSDKIAYIEHFKEKQIYDQTLRIPFPYTEADARGWIQYNIDAAKAQGGRSVNWAIRRAQDGFLVGGIGFVGFKVGESHQAEIGYFLAKPYWGQGLMTEAVKKVTEYGFTEFGLIRITAPIFHFNVGSARVLEKAGYQCEGRLRSHYKKDGKILDGILYAIVAGDLPKDQGSRPRPDFIKHYSEIQDPDDAHYPDSEELLSIGSPFAKKFGLTRLGIHHKVLPPGRRTSWPHAESEEEEFAYVIEGHPDVWIDGHLHRLRPGDAVGFVPGTGIGHTFMNNTKSQVRLLVVGETTKKTNKVFYSLDSAANERAKKEGWFWDNAPERSLGEHDGCPEDPES